MLIMMKRMIKWQLSTQSDWKGDRDQKMPKFMAENLYGYLRKVLPLRPSGTQRPERTFLHRTFPSFSTHGHDSSSLIQTPSAT